MCPGPHPPPEGASGPHVAPRGHAVTRPPWNTSPPSRTTRVLCLPPAALTSPLGWPALLPRPRACVAPVGFTAVCTVVAAASPASLVSTRPASRPHPAPGPSRPEEPPGASLARLTQPWVHLSTPAGTPGGSLSLFLGHSPSGPRLLSRDQEASSEFFHGAFFFFEADYVTSLLKNPSAKSHCREDTGRRRLPAARCPARPGSA